MVGIDARPVGGVVVNCGAIPIGIEPQQFLRKLRDPGVIEAIRKLKAQFGKRKVKCKCSKKSVERRLLLSVCVIFCHIRLFLVLTV